MSRFQGGRRECLQGNDYGEEEQSSVPSEFDHLFRDSSPQERRSISGRQPMVSGPGAAASPGFPQAATQQAQTAQGAPAAQQLKWASAYATAEAKVKFVHGVPVVPAANDGPVPASRGP